MIRRRIISKQLSITTCKFSVWIFWIVDQTCCLKRSAANLALALRTLRLCAKSLFRFTQSLLAQSQIERKDSQRILIHTSNIHCEARPIFASSAYKLKRAGKISRPFESPLPHNNGRMKLTTLRSKQPFYKDQNRMRFRRLISAWLHRALQSLL